MSMTREELMTHLQEDFGKPAADMVMRFALPMARIAMEDLDGDEIPVGASKYGGLPDLPEGTAWPMATAIRPHTPEGHKYPLTFVAQINFAEASPFLGDDPAWPREGLLSFFFDAVCCPVGDHDRRETEGFRLIWSPTKSEPIIPASPPSPPTTLGAKLSALFRKPAVAPAAAAPAAPAAPAALKRAAQPTATAPSEGNAEKFVLGERRITFTSTWTLVNGEGTESDAMGNVAPEPWRWFGRTFPVDHGPRHRLSGHAQPEQNDPVDECAERSRFLRTGAPMRPMGEIMSGPPTLPDPATRWRLLFQFDFSEEPDIACAYEHTQFYVCISEASIRNRKFDEAAWTWDSD